MPCRYRSRHDTASPFSTTLQVCAMQQIDPYKRQAPRRAAYGRLCLPLLSDTVTEAAYMLRAPSGPEYSRLIPVMYRTLSRRACTRRIAQPPALTRPPCATDPDRRCRPPDMGCWAYLCAAPHADRSIHAMHHAAAAPQAVATSLPGAGVAKGVQLHTLIEGGRDVFELISDSEPEPDSEVEVGTAPIRPSSRASNTDDFNLSGQSGTDDFRDGASDVDDHGGNVNPIVEHGMDRFQFILNGHHFQDDSDKDDPRPSDTLWEDDITSSVRTGRFTITQKIKVQRLECLSEIPSIWPIPRISTAFVIDLDNDKHNIINPDTHGSRSYHPKCGQRCLEVSPGSPWSASPLHINPELLARVAAVSRFELDPSSRTAGLAAEAETRRNEGTTPEQHAAMQVVHIAYRKRCTGGPILKAKPQGFSRGHMYFVACSGWNPKFKDDHRTHQIPDHVDENLLARFLAGMTIADGDEKDTKPCSKFVHPRTGFRQHFCPHSHIKDGQQVRGKIVQLTCTARRAIYVPVDTSIRKALIVHNDTGHNHPMPTLIKASFSTKETYKNLLQAVGVVGATVSKVDNLHRPRSYWVGNQSPLSRRHCTPSERNVPFYDKSKLSSFPMDWMRRVREIELFSSSIYARGTSTQGRSTYI
ncbi:hypothetical protein C8F04DRAFT_1400047 [Mycena alexandri]|uniref:Uncharacterized protein n=1 Tax=Mycena alexandri TaxID=1745969 RepID=A0AAD6SF29_9AGAR|nr:hypothetical protein C8F04DRAFT_1400047 [Mycena alexandri]